MALIERVDTTMYAFGGPRHFLALGGVIAAVVACQSDPPPGECKASADEVAHYVAALDRSPRLVDATAWDSLHLVERRELPAPADAAPTLVVEANRFVYAGESIESADELALALRNAPTRARPRSARGPCARTITRSARSGSASIAPARSRRTPAPRPGRRSPPPYDPVRAGWRHASDVRETPRVTRKVCARRVLASACSNA